MGGTITKYDMPLHDLGRIVEELIAETDATTLIVEEPSEEPDTMTMIAVNSCEESEEMAVTRKRRKQ